MTQTAVGRVRDPDGWPFPVVAAPRGFQEIAWSVSLTLALGALVLTCNGGYLLAVALTTALLFHVTPRTLLVAAIAQVTVAWVFLAVTVDQMAYIRRIWILIAHATPPSGTALEILGWTALMAPWAFATVAFLQLHDTRSVKRGVVDERVWLRQQSLRRRILREEALRFPPPMVTS